MSFISLGTTINKKKRTNKIPSRKLAYMITAKLSYRINVVMSSSLSCFFLFWWKLTVITLTLKKGIFSYALEQSPNSLGTTLKNTVRSWCSGLSNTISNAVISYSSFP